MEKVQAEALELFKRKNADFWGCGGSHSYGG